MIKNFESFKKIQSFGNGFSQWTNGDLAHSAKVLIDDDRVTRNLVRSAFKVESVQGVFTHSDAIHGGLPH